MTLCLKTSKTKSTPETCSEEIETKNNPDISRFQEINLGYPPLLDQQMNYHAASSGVSKGTTMSEVKVKLLFKVFSIRTLVRDILLDAFRIGVFAHSVRIETACPLNPTE
jgi:hypothetical protein